MKKEEIIQGIIAFIPSFTIGLITYIKTDECLLTQLFTIALFMFIVILYDKLSEKQSKYNCYENNNN